MIAAIDSATSGRLTMAILVLIWLLLVDIIWEAYKRRRR